MKPQGESEDEYVDRVSATATKAQIVEALKTLRKQVDEGNEKLREMAKERNEFDAARAKAEYELNRLRDDVLGPRIEQASTLAKMCHALINAVADESDLES